jgi:hypothetical protein
MTKILGSWEDTRRGRGHKARRHAGPQARRILLGSWGDRNRGRRRAVRAEGPRNTPCVVGGS